MNAAEVYELLKTAAAVDERVLSSPERATAWQPILADVTFEAGVEALYAFLRVEARTVRPSDLVYLAGSQQPAQPQDDPFTRVLEGTDHSLTPQQEMDVRRMIAEGRTSDEILAKWRGDIMRSLDRGILQ